MTRTIVWTDSIPENALDIVRDQVPPGFKLITLPKATTAAAAELVGQADYLYCSGTVPINGALLDLAPKLRFIQKHGVGVEVLDMDAIRARNIPCCYTANINADGVAEQVMLLMLATLRLLPVVDRQLRADGTFSKWDLRPQCFEVQGKVVGIVGLGAIGQGVAERLSGFEAQVVYHKRSRLPVAEEAKYGVTYLGLEELLATSDIVCLTLPLTPESHHLINAERLALMKRSAYLINVSRGGIVDEAALIQALRDKRLAGAGLDVFDPEPPSVNNPLFAMQNVVVTPHTGGGTADTFRRVFGKAMYNIQQVENGGQPHSEDVLVAARGVGA